MNKYILLLFIASTLQGCGSESNSVEQEAENPVIYGTEREFTFLVSHFDTTGNPSGQDTLILTSSSEVFSKEYGQTKSSWKALGKESWRSYSGIEESDTAVWIHPPRVGKYKKLELSPFPMIQYPLEVGHTWTWSLLIGNHYSIPGHAEWADKTNEEFSSNYSITQKLPLQTKLGTLTCFEIDSFTKSNFVQTELKAYYNTAYGFVKLDYLNIDKGRLTLELVALKKGVLPKYKLPVKQFEIK